MQISDSLQVSALQGGRSLMNSAEASKERAETYEFNEKLKEAQQAFTQNTAKKAVTDAEEAAANKKLMDACKGFETMFLDMMYRQMRQTVPKDTLFGHDNTDDILESMRDTAMVEKMSEAGGIGLAKTLYEQLQRDAHAIKVDK